MSVAYCRIFRIREKISETVLGDRPVPSQPPLIRMVSAENFQFFVIQKEDVLCTDFRDHVAVQKVSVFIIGRFF